MGKTEDAVLPILTDKERKKLDVLRQLLAAIDASGDPEYQKVLKSDEAAQIRWQLDLDGKKTNTNYLLATLNDEICRDFATLGITVDEKVFPGVYPTYSFNAQARAEGDGYLILVDTGCFETIEAAVTILLRPWTHDQKTTMFVRTIRDYCRHGRLTRSEELKEILSEKENGLEIATELQMAEEITPGLTNACERFVIAHEYGHVIRGHFAGALSTDAGANHELQVIYKEHEKEFEADLWALNVLIRQTDMYDARMRLITYAGALIPLGICLLVEDCRKMELKRNVGDSHPPALERMRLLQTYYERLNWPLDFKGSGRFDGLFLRLVSDCSRMLGGEGIQLVKSKSVESLDEASDAAYQLASAFGVPLSNHERILSEGNEELMMHLVDRMNLNLVAPAKPPIVQALDYAHNIGRWMLYGLALLVVVVIILASILCFLFLK
jgi:hypothetical protein